jgi:hypothetical protein
MMKIIKFCFIILTSYFILPTSYLHSQSGWGPDVRLTYFWGYSYNPRAACNGDTVHLVWWESYAHEEVFYKRSTDAGWTWEADVRLSVEDTQTSALPQIAVSGNTVHVIWFEDDFGLLYRRSTDDGASWGNIDSIVPLGVHSSIDVFGDTVYICGITGSTGDLLFTKSIDNGNNWEPIQTITPAHDSPTLRNMLNNALDIVISYEYTPEIYNVRSFDGGEIWLDSQLVSEGIASGSQMPAMDPDDSAGIHITWFDYKYSPYPWTGDIFYRASRDSGNTWEPIDSLTIQHRAVASDILTEGNNLHLVWEDDRHDFGNNFEIYYRMSTDLGQSWEPEARLTDTLNWSRRPSLACDGQYLHLFWFDLRDDPSNIVGEIYYKRKNLTGINETPTVKFLPSGLSLDCSTILTRNSLIRYDLGNNKEGEINLIDVTGKVIETFPVHHVSGEFVLGFNKEVCDGVYFIMLRAGASYTTRKVLVVR